MCRTVPILAAVLLVVAAGGCGAESQNLRTIRDQADFDRTVLWSSQPVLVSFYKENCPSCRMLNPTLDRLATEYKHRVVFAEFETVTATLDVPSEKIKRKYDIEIFPTVIVFLNGRQKYRFVGDPNIENYREALNDVCRYVADRTASHQRGG